LSNLKHLKKTKLLYPAVKDVSPLYKIPGFEKIEYHWDLNYIMEYYSRVEDYFDPPVKAIDVIKQLLEVGADPNKKSEERTYFGRGGGTTYFLETKITPLMRSRDPELTKLLIKYGARVNEVDEYGRTALMISSFFDGIKNEESVAWGERGNEEKNLIGKILIDNGADKNIKSYTGQTALHFAVIGYNIESIRMLTENGANVNIRNNKGLTPLMSSMIYHYFSYENKYPEYHERIKQILIKAGAVLSDDDIKKVNKLKVSKEANWYLGLERPKHGSR